KLFHRLLSRMNQFGSLQLFYNRAFQTTLLCERFLAQSLGLSAVLQPSCNTLAFLLIEFDLRFALAFGDESECFRLSDIVLLKMNIQVSRWPQSRGNFCLEQSKKRFLAQTGVSAEDLIEHGFTEPKPLSEPFPRELLFDSELL